MKLMEIPSFKALNPSEKGEKARPGALAIHMSGDQIADGS